MLSKRSDDKRVEEGHYRPLLLSLPLTFSATLAPPLAVSLPVISFDVGRVWSAVAVAALAVSVYALKRYWHSLEGQPRRVRISLMAMRCAALLLVIFALAGLRVDYESKTPGRVLILYGFDAAGRSDAGDSGLTRMERMSAALRQRGLEAVAAADGDAPLLPKEQNFIAAVLLTDGALPVENASRLVERTSVAAGGAPVFALYDQRETVEPGVALEGVVPLGRVTRGVPLSLRLIVHGRRMGGRESLITISDEAKVEASTRVRWTADDERRSATIEVVPKVSGWINYVARVEGAGGEDTRLLTRAFALYAEERRMRVLFFEGEPTWEAKFIRRALEQTRLFDVDYFAQVSRAATVGATPASTEEGGTDRETATRAGADGNRAGAPEAKLHAALASAASLNLYDCIIVGATPDVMLSAAEASRVQAWVERRGGGLVVLGGNSFAGSIAAPNGKLYQLLPTSIEQRGLLSTSEDISRGTPLEAERSRSGRALVPTEQGAAGPLSAYLSAFESAIPTAVLTGQGFHLGQLRAGASVLAVAGQAGATATNNVGEPVVAATRYGSGRTLLFAPADSWRIRTSASGEQDEVGGPFGALWQGIALWAAEGARAQVEIVLSDETPSAGQSLTAEIRVRDASFAPLKIERLSVRLQPLVEETNVGRTNAPQAIVFAPSIADASVWRAEFIAPAIGQYSLEASYSAGESSGSTEKRFGVGAASPVETGTALDTLQRTTREHGGDLFYGSDLGAMLERLASRPQGLQSVHSTWELRTFWPLAFLLPLLLSAEWLARRWWRLD